MRLRHAESLAATIAAEPDLPQTTTACRTIARFAIDAYALARGAADPEGALDEIFRIIGAAWEAAGGRRADERGRPTAVDQPSVVRSVQAELADS